MISRSCSFAALLFISTVSAQTNYLALGDSIAFGYNPLVPQGTLADYGGYPELVAPALKLNLANASCIGETSTSFITGLAKDDLSPYIPSEGCEDYRAKYPLFVNYSGPQLNYAISQLQTNRKIELVTINIGGNDLAVLEFQCNFDTSCEEAGLPRALATYAGNLTNILERLRGEAGYRGPITVLTYYAFNYSLNPTDIPQTAAIGFLNATAAVVGKFFDVTIADGFGAYAKASLPYGGDVCAAGLLIALPGGTCDTHPDTAGQQLLANTVVGATHLH
jgi:lysophospholipase L1-like esterase